MTPSSQQTKSPDYPGRFIVTQPDHCATRGPRRRSDSTRPASTRSAPRRGRERRPYPTAPTTTRVSPAKPGSTGATSRSRGSRSTPTPATVWAAGPVPIDLDAAWPTPLVTKIVSSFSEPGGRVALLPWPGTGGRPTLTAVDAGGVIDRAPGTEPDAELAAALVAIESLDRVGRVVRIPVDSTLTGPASRPFWADLVDGPDHPHPAVAPSRRPGLGGDASDSAPGASPDADLVITTLRPEHGGDRSSDHVALLAARLLRVGGILVVLTHCDWSTGELMDPSGPVVASAQNADLLYLQHVVALHAPVANGEFSLDLDGRAPERDAHAQHRAGVRGLPTPHRRVHSDVLVFAQPHDHQPPPPLATGAASRGGDLR
jgi:hypothetical protein